MNPNFRFERTEYLSRYAVRGVPKDLGQQVKAAAALELAKLVA